MSLIITLGWITIAYLFYKFIYKLYNIVYPYLIAKPVDLKKLAGADWAVVTGSTDGIGKQYTIELASRGFNIVLVSRTQSKLDRVKQEILHESPNIQVKTIAFDFTNANLEDYQQTIIKQINDLDVGILVNNVGMSYELPDRFDKIPTKQQRDLAIVNTLPTTILTSEILKQMVPKNKGVIINISSTAAIVPIKYYSLYSASKIFVTWLTEILLKEFGNTGIVFQVVHPGRVTTNMTMMSSSEATLFEPTAERFVKQALNTVGHVSETTGCLAHEIQVVPALLLPDFLKDMVAEKMRDNKRRRVLAKKGQ